MGSSLLQVRDVSKTYDDVRALEGVSLDVAETEVVALLGPSGCGKTTLLRIIAGLEVPDTGAVYLAGREITSVPPHRRGFGLMFQDYVLFPHQDVFHNVAFGLEMQGWDRERVRERVREMLALVGLSGYERRRVFELSGGEQQRVALARSLAPEPRLLMLDEPLGSLDRTLREQLLDELRQILHQVGVTALYVTHDQQEAFALADRVIILRSGRVVQQGTPEEIYRHPADAFVARFLGHSNLIPGRVRDRRGVETKLGLLVVPDAADFPSGARVTVLIRPEAAELTADADAPNRVSVRVLDRSFRGDRYRIQVAHAGGLELTLEIVPLDRPPPEPGEEVTISLHPAGLALLAVKG